MQQRLPFTVLKLLISLHSCFDTCFGVAIVLTVYGIETLQFQVTLFHLVCSVATALTVYGIETSQRRSFCFVLPDVATALTVYGIETYPP